MSKIENKPANLKCNDCGHEFVASVPQRAHFVDEFPQPFRWTVENTGGVTCPSCGSRSVTSLGG